MERILSQICVWPTLIFCSFPIECEVVPVHVMMAYGRMELQIHSFLAPTLPLYTWG